VTGIVQKVDNFRPEPYPMLNGPENQY